MGRHTETQRATHRETESHHIYTEQMPTERQTPDTHTHVNTYTQRHRCTGKHTNISRQTLTWGIHIQPGNHVLVITHPSTHRKAGTQSHTSRVMQIQMHTHTAIIHIGTYSQRHIPAHTALLTQLHRHTEAHRHTFQQPQGSIFNPLLCEPYSEELTKAPAHDGDLPQTHSDSPA